MVQDATRSQISPELLFVLECAKFPEVEYEKLNRILASGLDWDLVLDLALAHLVFPLVYKAITALDSRSVPAYVSQTLLREYKRSSLLSVSIAGETVRIAEIMEENGIQVLVLKGAPLAQMLYQDITLRPCNDIDILVDPQEFLLAEKSLHKAKYKRSFPDYRQEKLFIKKYRHFAYFNAERGVEVELHWRAVHPDLEGFPATADLKVQKMDIWGHKVNTLADEELLLYLIAHGSNHMWLRLRWLVDVAVLAKKNISWSKIMEMAGSKELKTMVRLTAILLSELWAIPLPEPLAQSTAGDKKAKKLAGIVLERLKDEKAVKNSKSAYWKSLKQKNIYHVNLRSGWGKKLSYLLRNFHPKGVDVQLISLPCGLFWLYYFIRPFYWLKRRLILVVKARKFFN